MYRESRRKRSGHFERQLSGGDFLRRELHDQLCRLAHLPDLGYRTRDPVYSITEAFSTRFTLEGQRLTGQMLEQSGQPLEKGAARPAAEQMPYQVSETQRQSGLRLQKFADAAFSKGTLAAGILGGQGRMMLISSLKRTLGQPEPVNERQQILKGACSVQKNLPGNEGQVVYNRQDVKSAVGLVVGSLRSAGRLFQTMAEAAEGPQSPLAQADNEILLRMYPFLSVRDDQKTLHAWRGRLKELEIGEANREEADVLRRGIASLEALIQRKQAQKIQFISRFSILRDNAEQAEQLFSAEGFAEELAAELTAAAMPPEDGRRGEARRYSQKEDGYEPESVAGEQSKPEDAAGEDAADSDV
ncbi:hypothetical protein [Anaerotruncus colihominis]|uniref:hypothetical protein n=1 Tax=Anaerotruncus colihominis TaxID=169435 RepID=UPI00242F94C4|nr:hypothetical protein [Anaerotruncus colihominis]